MGENVQSGTRPLAASGPLPGGTQPLPAEAPKKKGGILGGALGFVKDVFVGGGEAIWDMAKGVGNMVLHPIQTAKGIAYLATTLVTNPKEGLSMIGHAFVDPYIEAVKSGHPGKALGRGIVEIGSLFVSPQSVVQGAKGAVAFGQGAAGALKAGQGVATAAKTGYYAGKWTMQASSYAVKAERLAKLGHVGEAAKMAQMANASARAAQVAKLGNVSKVGHYANLFGRLYHVNVAGTMMKSAELLAHSDALIRAGRFSWLAGGAKATAETAEAATRASLVAKAVMAGKALEPGLVRGFLTGKVALDGAKAAEILAAAGAAGRGAKVAVAAGEVAAQESRWSQLASSAARFAMQNPAILYPISPAAGLALDLLGRINAIPKGVDPKTVTEDETTALARKYGLDTDPVNVRTFLIEVQSYEGNALGPDVGPAKQIKQLQTLLRALGYDSDKTGVWDEKTTRAMIDYKTRNGFHQSYKKADGQFAVNEYATPDVISHIIQKLES
ncbi:MAG: peptidoglycan-binding protein [Candidatus Sericytochromatia bacterium]|nr:peptidoglycan-binding protein [Candidatus Tanganyikabacteria bacterium]